MIQKRLRDVRDDDHEHRQDAKRVEILHPPLGRIKVQQRRSQRRPLVGQQGRLGKPGGFGQQGINGGR